MFGPNLPWGVDVFGRTHTHPASACVCAHVRNYVCVRARVCAQAFVRDRLCACVRGRLLACACGDAPSIESLRSLHEVGDYAGALAPARVLLDENPDDPELNFLYGVSLSRTGEPSLSIWSFRKAMEDPEWRAAVFLW